MNRVKCHDELSLGLDGGVGCQEVSAPAFLLPSQCLQTGAFPTGDSSFAASALGAGLAFQNACQDFQLSS